MNKLSKISLDNRAYVTKIIFRHNIILLVSPTLYLKQPSLELTLVTRLLSKDVHRFIL